MYPQRPRAPERYGILLLFAEQQQRQQRQITALATEVENLKVRIIQRSTIVPIQNLEPWPYHVTRTM
jgi:hypothetical protein